MNKTTNSLIQIIKAQDNPELQQAYKDLIPSEDQLTNLTDVDKKFSRINDMMETIIQAYFQEQMAQTSQNAEGNKLDFSHFRESENIPRSIYEQERTQWQAEKQALEEKVASLTKDLDETKAALVENCAGSWNEEKENQKKMEMWFKRRLDAIEHHILDLKAAPQEEAKFERLLNKVRHVKKKQPWNDSKKPNLVLDDAALDQKSEIYSNGTSTPFSHYVCVLSSAASENNPLDKGFMCSINNSCRLTNKSQHSFLSEPLSKSIRNTKQAHLESVMKKLQDSRLSISEKEKLFCDMYKHSPSANDAFVHVRLEDILNAANVSRSHDSLSLDLQANGGQPKYTFRFNQNMRLDNLKDTKLEKAISTIPSQGSQKSSELFGTSLKRSKSLEHEKMLFFGSPEKNLEHLMALDMTDKKEDIQSALDKGIIQDISIEQRGGGQFIEQESNNMLDLLQNMLSSKKPILLRGHDEVGRSEILNKKEIDLSEIVNKKDDEMNIGKLDEKPSFLGDEDDEEFKNFLEKEGKDLSILHSINKHKQLTSQKKCSSKKKERMPFDVKNIEKNLSKKFSEAIEETSSVENDKENQHTMNEAIILESPEKQHQEEGEEEQEEEEDLVHSQVVVRKSSEIPILDFNKIKEKFQKHSTKIVSPTIIVDSAIHISSAETQKRDSEPVSSKSSTTEHIIVSPALINLTESPHIQQTRFSKVPIKAGPEAPPEGTSVSAFFGYYNPRKSMDAQPTFLQPRPPAIIKKKIHPRPNLSLVDDVKLANPNAYEKPPQRPHHPSHSPSMFNMGSDLFLDVEYQFQYQEQEGCQDNFQAHQVKKSVDFRQNHRVDYNKNTRNSWSFTIDQDQKFGNPSKAQMHSQISSQLGRNTHLRQKTTEPGPPKAQNQSYFVRSSFSSTPQQFQAIVGAVQNGANLQANVSNPSSYESTQEAEKIIVNNGLNILKKVLPGEHSKVHQTPIKLEHSGMDSQLKEMVTVQKENKTPKEFLTNSREKGREMRPISPLNQNRGGDPDFKLALPLQRKSKFAEEKYISIANTPVNGSAQFRARMFAPKKV